MPPGKRSSGSKKHSSKQQSPASLPADKAATIPTKHDDNSGNNNNVDLYDPFDDDEDDAAAVRQQHAAGTARGSSPSPDQKTKVRQLKTLFDDLLTEMCEEVVKEDGSAHSSMEVLSERLLAKLASFNGSQKASIRAKASSTFLQKIAGGGKGDGGLPAEQQAGAAAAAADASRSGGSTKSVRSNMVSGKKAATPPPEKKVEEASVKPTTNKENKRSKDGEEKAASASSTSNTTSGNKRKREDDDQAASKKESTAASSKKNSGEKIEREKPHALKVAAADDDDSAVAAADKAAATKKSSTSPLASNGSPTVPVASPTSASVADAEVQIYWDADNVSGKPYTQPAVLLMSILEQLVNDGVIESNAKHNTQVYFVDRDNSRGLDDRDKRQLRDAQCTLVQCTKRKEDADRQIAAAIRRQIDNKHDPASRPILIVSSDKDFNSILQDAKRAGLPTYVVHAAIDQSLHETLLKLYATTFSAKELVERHKPTEIKEVKSSRRGAVGHNNPQPKSENASPIPNETKKEKKPKAEAPPQVQIQIIEKDRAEIPVPDVTVNKVKRPAHLLVDNEGLRRLISRGLGGQFGDPEKEKNIATSQKIFPRQVRVGDTRTPVCWWALDPTNLGYKAATDPKNSNVANYWWCPKQNTCEDGEKCTHLRERFLEVYIPPKENRTGEKVTLPVSCFVWNQALQQAMEPVPEGAKVATPVVCVAYLRGQPHDEDTCRALHPKLLKLTGMRRRYASEFIPNPGLRLAVHTGVTLPECDCKNPETCTKLHLRPLTERTVEPIVREQKVHTTFGRSLPDWDTDKAARYNSDAAAARQAAAAAAAAASSAQSNKKLYTPSQQEIEWAREFLKFYGLDLPAVFTVDGYQKLKTVHEQLQQDTVNRENLTNAVKYLRSVEELARQFNVPAEPIWQ